MSEPKKNDEKQICRIHLTKNITEIAEYIKERINADAVWLCTIGFRKKAAVLSGYSGKMPASVTQALFKSRLILSSEISITRQTPFFLPIKKILNNLTSSQNIYKKITGYLTKKEIPLSKRICLLPLKYHHNPVGILICYFHKNITAGGKETEKHLPYIDAAAEKLYLNRNEKYIQETKEFHKAHLALSRTTGLEKKSEKIYRHLCKFLVENYDLNHIVIWETGDHYLKPLYMKKEDEAEILKILKKSPVLNTDFSQIEGTPLENIMPGHSDQYFYTDGSDVPKLTHNLKKLFMFYKQQRREWTLFQKFNQKYLLTATAEQKTDDEYICESLAHILSHTLNRIMVINEKETLETNLKKEKMKADFSQKLNEYWNTKELTVNALKNLRKHFSAEGVFLYHKIRNTTMFVQSSASPKQLKNIIPLYEKNLLSPLSSNPLLKVFEDDKNLKYKIFHPQDLIQNKKLFFYSENSTDEGALRENISNSGLYHLVFKIHQSYYLLMLFKTLPDEFTRFLIFDFASMITARLGFIKNHYELKKLKINETRLEDNNRAGMVIGQKLSQKINQAENAYYIGNNISSFFKNSTLLIKRLLWQTSNINEPAKELELNAFAKSTAEIFFHGIEGIRIHYNFHNSEIRISMKAAALRDCIIQFLRNAIFHGKADEIIISSTYEKSNKSSMAQLVIEDNGTGIKNPVILKGLGTPDNSADGKTYGMGLHRVANDLKNAGGYFEYKREKNKTRFILFLPPVVSATNDKILKKLSPAELTNKKVLIIDDEKRNISLYKGVFIALGIQNKNILTAENGHEAVAKYKQNRRKIINILCDYFIGLETGIEVFNKIRFFDRGVYFTFISGIPETPEIRQARKRYPDNTMFIQKGVDGLHKIEKSLKHAIRRISFKDYHRMYNNYKNFFPLFVEGFVHRLNNMIVFPMTLSDLYLNYDVKESITKDQIEKIRRLFTTFDVLKELAVFPGLIIFLRSMFKCDSLTQKEKLTAKEKTLLRQHFKSLEKIRGGLKKYPEMKKAVEEQKKSNQWHFQNRKGSKPYRNSVATLLNESTGKVFTVIDNAHKDSMLENQLKQAFQYVYTKIKKINTGHYINEDNTLRFTEIKDYCSRVSAVTNTFFEKYNTRTEEE